MNLTDLRAAIRDEIDDTQETVFKPDNVLLDRLINRGNRETLKITEALIMSESITVVESRVIYSFSSHFSCDNVLKLKRVLFDNDPLERYLATEMDDKFADWRDASNEDTITKYIPWGAIGIKVNPPASATAVSDGKQLTIEFIPAPVTIDGTNVYPFTFIDSGTYITNQLLYDNYCEPIINYVLWKTYSKLAVPPDGSAKYKPIAEMYKRDFYTSARTDKATIHDNADDYRPEEIDVDMPHRKGY